MNVTTLDQIKPLPRPACPDCGQPMTEHGGTHGYTHCGWKLLYRPGGWTNGFGEHIDDPRLAKGGRRW